MLQIQKYQIQISNYEKSENENLYKGQIQYSSIKNKFFLNKYIIRDNEKLMKKIIRKVLTHC